MPTSITPSLPVAGVVLALLPLTDVAAALPLTDVPAAMPLSLLIAIVA
jgi:hypothetical protein